MCAYVLAAVRLIFGLFIFINSENRIVRATVIMIFIPTKIGSRTGELHQKRVVNQPCILEPHVLVNRGGYRSEGILYC